MLCLLYFIRFYLVSYVVSHRHETPGEDHSTGMDTEREPQAWSMVTENRGEGV